jgi:hypothetical protein
MGDDRIQVEGTIVRGGIINVYIIAPSAVTAGVCCNGKTNFIEVVAREGERGILNIGGEK